jgi:hypothetical protein
MWPSCERKSGRLRTTVSPQSDVRLQQRACQANLDVGIVAVNALQRRLVLRHRLGGAIGRQQCIGQTEPVVRRRRHLERVLRRAQFARGIEHLFHPADQCVAVSRVAHFRQPDHQCVDEAAQSGERKQNHEPIAVLPAAHRVHGKEHRDDHVQAKAQDRHVGSPQSDVRLHRRAGRRSLTGGRGFPHGIARRSA